MIENKYWVIVASKDHVTEGVRGGFAQACHGKSKPLQRMSENDFVVYYSSKEKFGELKKCQEFTAIGKVKNNEVYNYFVSDDFCPARISIDFLSCREVSILPLIHNLDFIKNKKKWGYPFRWGFFEISFSDFKLIYSKMILKEDGRGNKVSF